MTAPVIAGPAIPLRNAIANRGATENIDPLERICSFLGLPTWASEELIIRKTDELIANARAADELIKNVEQTRAVIIRNRAERILRENKNFPGGLSAAYHVAAQELDTETAKAQQGQRGLTELRAVRIRNRAEQKLRENKNLPGGLSAAFNSATIEIGNEDRYVLPEKIAAAIGQEPEDAQAKKIAVRSSEIHKQNPHLSFLAAWNMALRELQGTDGYEHVRGHVRHLDTMLEAQGRYPA